MSARLSVQSCEESKNRGRERVREREREKERGRGEKGTERREDEKSCITEVGRRSSSILNLFQIREHKGRAYVQKRERERERERKRERGGTKVERYNSIEKERKRDRESEIYTQHNTLACTHKREHKEIERGRNRQTGTVR